MRLDDTIRYCEEKSNDAEYGSEHKQLAEWLQELKDIREFVEPLRNFNTKNLYLEKLKDVVKKNESKEEPT